MGFEGKTNWKTALKNCKASIKIKEGKNNKKKSSLEINWRCRWDDSNDTLKATVRSPEDISCAT